MPQTKSLKIPNQLQDYIQNVSLHAYQLGESSMLLPSGKMDIILQKETSFYHKVNGQKVWKLRPKSFIGGLHDQIIQYKSAKDDNELLVITFKEGKAHAVFKESAFRFFKKTISLPSNHYHMSLFEAAKENELELNQFLTLVDKEPDLLSANQKLIISAIEIIKEQRGFMNISQLSNKIGFSIAHFRKLFRDNVGCSPSLFCRLIRVKHSLQSIRSQPSASLTDIAYQQSYSDQSHFIKDFKKITRLAPRQFLNLMKV